MEWCNVVLLLERCMKGLVEGGRWHGRRFGTGDGMDGAEKPAEPGVARLVVEEVALVAQKVVGVVREWDEAFDDELRERAKSGEDPSPRN